MKFNDYPAIGRGVIMVVGDSGAGKTSSLASLANAGYNLRVLDLDNKLSVLRKHLTEEGAGNVSVMTFKDALNKKADAYKRFKNVVYNGWKDDDEDLGKLETWGPDTVLAIDSATFLGDIIKNEARAMDGKANFEKLSQANWYDAILQVENLFNFLTSDFFKCHLVMTALPLLVEDEAGISKFYPNIVTKNFSAGVGKYFDNVVRISSKRDGSRIIRTGGDNRMELKVSGDFPLEIPADLSVLLAGITGNKTDTTNS